MRMFWTFLEQCVIFEVYTVLLRLHYGHVSYAVRVFLRCLILLRAAFVLEKELPCLRPDTECESSVIVSSRARAFLTCPHFDEGLLMWQACFRYIKMYFAVY